MTVELMKSIIKKNIKKLENDWTQYNGEPNICQAMGGSKLMDEIDDKVELLQSIFDEYDRLVAKMVVTSLE